MGLLSEAERLHKFDVVSIVAMYPSKTGFPHLRNRVKQNVMGGFEFYFA